MGFSVHPCRMKVRQKKNFRAWKVFYVIYVIVCFSKLTGYKQRMNSDINYGL